MTAYGGVGLRIGVSNLVSADRLEIRLNGARPGQRVMSSLADPVPGSVRGTAAWNSTWKTCDPGRAAMYSKYPCAKDPPGFEGGIVVEDVDIFVEYGTFPTPRPAPIE